MFIIIWYIRTLTINLNNFSPLLKKFINVLFCPCCFTNSNIIWYSWLFRWRICWWCWRRWWFHWRRRWWCWFHWRRRWWFHWRRWWRWFWHRTRRRRWLWFWRSRWWWWWMGCRWVSRFRSPRRHWTRYAYV